MKKIKLLMTSILILIVFAFTVNKKISWKIKEDYSVTLSGGISFKGLKATILFDEEDPANSKISASIDARTLTTDNTLKTEHAKEALATNKFPAITFVSTEIIRSSIGYEASGYLTLKGITKKIKLPFKFDSKKSDDKFPFTAKQTFNGSFTIVPKKFNITREGTPETVTIELIIPVEK